MFPAEVWKNALEVPRLVLLAIPRAVRGWLARRNGSPWWWRTRVLEQVIKAHVCDCQIVQLNFSIKSSKGDV